MNKYGSIRFGFATNSSSTHSLIILKDNQHDLKTRGYYNDQQFGWDKFILADRDSKVAYLGQQIARSIKEALDLDDQFSYLIASRLLGTEIDENGYVDHQSSWTIPISTSRCNARAMRLLVKRLKQFISRDDVAIFGGNDNECGGDFGDDFGEKVTEITSEFPAEPREHAARFKLVTTTYSWREEDEQRIVLFSPFNGTKIVLSGNDLRPDSPELIDLKITDQCNSGCEFCYQNSSSGGNHATMEQLENFIGYVRERNILEVAIGGGEPTLHPDLLWFLKQLRDSGVVPSISTRNIDKFKNDPAWSRMVFDLCGGVALSTHSIEEARQWKELVPNDGGVIYHSEVIYHYVLGIEPLENLEQFLKNTGGTVLLLDHKKVGRAVNQEIHNYDGWLDIVKENSDRRIAIDSFLAKKLVNFDPDGKIVMPQTFDPHADGKVSMYVDLVDEQYAAHSFVSKDEQLSFIRPHEFPQFSDMWKSLGPKSNNDIK